MEQVNLNVESRLSGTKGDCRRIRRAGKLPGVLYGLGNHAPIIVDPKIVERILLSEGGKNKILYLAGDKLKGKAALIKDYQVDPVSRKLLHVDLLEIDLSKKITVTVPITITGKSVGVAEGGVLNFIERTIQVSCLPTAIPGHIDIDVTSLKIGDSLHANDVKLPEGIELGSAMNPTLVAVVPPAKEEDATPSLAPTAEPEVITAKKPEEGEAAAGADAKKEEKKK